MDNTLRVWDVRPYAAANRCTKVFTGHQHNFEKNLLKCAWSPDGTKVRQWSAKHGLCSLGREEDTCMQTGHTCASSVDVRIMQFQSVLG